MTDTVAIRHDVDLVAVPFDAVRQLGMSLRPASG
jgi:hypothetical protein